MKIDVITLFPEMLLGFVNSSMLKKAQTKGLIQINMVNPRDFTQDKHKTCDDKPFGGGSGMVMKPEPIFEAFQKVKTAHAKTILMSPQGVLLSHTKALDLSKEEHLIFICGHYEGVDERIRMQVVDEEISIGDYVLTNGALAAAIVIDAVSRFIPGVLGNPDSISNESFSKGLLEYPQYTRPRVFKGLEVPDVLLSGDHQKIEAWRHEQAIEKTKRKRPDLM